jgi:Zn-dependent protease with chaperone function
MAYKTNAYRYPNESIILWVTVLLVMLVIAISATATLCLSVVFIVGMLLFSYSFARSQHLALMTHARQVTPAGAPGTAATAREAGIRLQVEPVEIFITPSRILNAYTFGLGTPKTIVLHSALFDVMDRDELQFIIGHEMGHVCLGHTWLNSLIGGMAGIPSSSEASILMILAFRWWNRACELSADRAGVLACGSPAKAISALIKLQAGPAGLSNPARLERALQSIEAEDDNLFNNLSELLATHPMIVKRIQQIRLYAATSEYAALQAKLNQNLLQTPASTPLHP